MTNASFVPVFCATNVCLLRRLLDCLGLLHMFICSEDDWIDAANRIMVYGFYVIYRAKFQN
jgi:hypothetical protein